MVQDFVHPQYHLFGQFKLSFPWVDIESLPWHACHRSDQMRLFVLRLWLSSRMANSKSQFEVGHGLWQREQTTAVVKPREFGVGVLTGAQSRIGLLRFQWSVVQMDVPLFGDFPK